VLSIKSKQREGQIEYGAESWINTLLNLMCSKSYLCSWSYRTSLPMIWGVFDKEARLLCRWSSAVICVVKEKLFSSWVSCRSEKSEKFICMHNVSIFVPRYLIIFIMTCPKLFQRQIACKTDWSVLVNIAHHPSRLFHYSPPTIDHGSTPSP